MLLVCWSSGLRSHLLGWVVGEIRCGMGDGDSVVSVHCRLGNGFELGRLRIE